MSGIRACFSQLILEQAHNHGQGVLDALEGQGSASTWHSFILASSVGRSKVLFLQQFSLSSSWKQDALIRLPCRWHFHAYGVSHAARTCLACTSARMPTERRYGLRILQEARTSTSSRQCKSQKLLSAKMLCSLLLFLKHGRLACQCHARYSGGPMFGDLRKHGVYPEHLP